MCVAKPNNHRLKEIIDTNDETRVLNDEYSSDKTDREKNVFSNLYFFFVSFRQTFFLKSRIKNINDHSTVIATSRSMNVFRQPRRQIYLKLRSLLNRMVS